MRGGGQGPALPSLAPSPRLRLLQTAREISSIVMSNSSLPPAQHGGKEEQGEDKVAFPSPFDKLPNELVVFILSLALPTRDPGTLDKLLLCKRFYNLGRPDWLSTWTLSTDEDGSVPTLLALLHRPSFHPSVLNLIWRLLDRHGDKVLITHQLAMLCVFAQLRSLNIEHPEAATGAATGYNALDMHTHLRETVRASYRKLKCFSQVLVIGDRTTSGGKIVYNDCGRNDCSSRTEVFISGAIPGLKYAEGLTTSDPPLHWYFTDPVFQQDAPTSLMTSLQLFQSAASHNVRVLRLRIPSKFDIPTRLPSVASVVSLVLNHESGVDETDYSKDMPAFSVLRLIEAFPSLEFLRWRGGRFSEGLNPTQRLSHPPSFVVQNSALYTVAGHLRRTRVTRFHWLAGPEEYRRERTSCGRNFQLERWQEVEEGRSGI